MKSDQRASFRKRLIGAYWLIVGIFGLGQPIVDRRSIYGDDPANDPYSPEYDPSPSRRR